MSAFFKAALSAALLAAALAVPCGLAEDTAGAQEEATRIGREQSELRENLEKAADSLYALIVGLMPDPTQGKKPAVQRLEDCLISAANWFLTGIRGLFDLLAESFEGNADPGWFRMEEQTGAMFTPGPDAHGALTKTY